MAVFFKISLFLLILAFVGLGIKMLFDKNAKFTGSSCGSCGCSSPDQKKCESK